MPETIFLSNWTRSFAEYAGFLIPSPFLVKVKVAIATYLPNQFFILDLDNLDTESLLKNELGITAILQIHTEKMVGVQ